MCNVLIIALSYFLGVTVEELVLCIFSDSYEIVVTILSAVASHFSPTSAWKKEVCKINQPNRLLIGLMIMISFSSKSRAGSVLFPPTKNWTEYSKQSSESSFKSVRCAMVIGILWLSIRGIPLLVHWWCTAVIWYLELGVKLLLWATWTDSSCISTKKCGNLTEMALA